MRALRGLVLAAAVPLVLAACGQHPGVRIAEADLTAVGGDASEVVAQPGTEGPAEVVDPFEDLHETGEDLDTPASEQTAPGEETAPQAPQQEQRRQVEERQEGNGADGRRQVRGSDRTGATETTLTFAIHAPLTGAAPIPQQSPQAARNLYYDWHIAQGNTILGRTEIRSILRDDRYDPSAAVQVCRELAAEAFALGGAGGTDQIQACARFAERNSVPYISAGVTERGLRGARWYFAASMSYKQQGDLLADYVRAQFPGTRVGAVVTDTQNFDDNVEGWETGVARNNLDYYRTLRHPRGDSGWYTSFAADLRDAGVEVLFINTAPLDYIRFAQQAHQIGFTPQFVGVGPTMGLNGVLGSGCPEVDGGIFFSPFPGLDWARQNEPDFFTAAQQNDVPQDDLAFASWSAQKLNVAVLEGYEALYGTDLTREDFRDYLSQATGISNGIFPELNYSPQNNFGARSVHVLYADCDVREHTTLHAFAEGF